MPLTFPLLSFTIVLSFCNFEAINFIPFQITFVICLPFFVTDDL